MNNFNNSACPNCGKYGKTDKIDNDGKFYIECLYCKYQTPHFEFLVQAQANWIRGQKK